MYKKFINFREKLTSKQVKIISIVAGGTVFIILAVILFIIGKLDVISVPIVTLIAFGLMFFLICFLRAGEKEMQEEHERVKRTIIKKFKLNKHKLVQVHLVFLTKELREKIFSHIVEGEEISFFAILDEEENIRLICRNSEGRLVYKETISDYFFFEANFVQRSWFN